MSRNPRFLLGTTFSGVLVTGAFLLVNPGKAGAEEATASSARTNQMSAPAQEPGMTDEPIATAISATDALEASEPGPEAPEAASPSEAEEPSVPPPAPESSPPDLPRGTLGSDCK